MANGGLTSTLTVGSVIVIAALCFFAGFVAMNVWWTKAPAKCEELVKATVTQPCKELIPASRTMEMVKEANVAEKRIHQANARYRVLNEQLEQVRKNYVKFNADATCPPLKIRTGTLDQHLKQLESEIGKIRVRAKIPTPPDPKCPQLAR